MDSFPGFSHNLIAVLVCHSEVEDVSSRMVIRLTMNINCSSCMTTVFLYFLGKYWTHQYMELITIPLRAISLVDYILLKKHWNFIFGMYYYGCDSITNSRDYLFTFVREDPSELLTETRDIGSRYEHSFLPFQTLFWIYDGKRGFLFQFLYHPPRIVILKGYMVKTVYFLGSYPGN